MCDAGCVSRATVCVRGCFFRLLAALVIAGGGMAMAGESACVAYDVPRLPGIVIDGNSDDWGERGFRGGILVPSQGALKPPSDHDAGFRLGWDERGLLVLVEVRGDNVWVEADEGFGFYQKDSVQVFLARRDAGGYELAISPGMDPRYPEVRVGANDSRKVKEPPLRYEVARTKAGRGYTLEILLPWSNFNFVPRLGEEFGFMLIVNDADAARGRYSPRWSTPGGYRRGEGLRLAENVAPPVNLVVASGEYEELRRTRIRVDAVGGYVGSRVVLREGERVLAEGVLRADVTRASATFSLPMPPRGQPYGEMTVLVEGEAPLPLLLPDADEERARALMAADLGFQQYVFAGERFPTCSFADPALVVALIGPHQLETTFYDRDYNVVTSAVKPGRYGAVVRVLPAEGRPFMRFRTLFRVAREFDLNAMVLGVEAAVPPELGISPEVAQKHAGQFATLLRRPSSGGIARDPRAAVLFAGLFETPAEAPPANFYTDALARDRQWWVGLKRRLYGLDREFTTPLERPQRLSGVPAPTLREGTPVEAGVRAEALEQVHAICETWARSSDEAFSVCLARHGVVFFHRAYGQRGGRPLTVEDKSNVASITKMLAGTLIMMAVDAGLVDLDAPVSTYVPALRGVPTRKPVTLRRMYDHTAGFSDWVRLSDEMPDLEEVLAVVFPYLRVGEKFEYATSSYSLAGKVLENITGEALPQFYRRHLLEPLGCTHTDVGSMGAGARMTALDLARFGQMLANRGAYGPWRFMSEETFAKMLPPPAAKAPGADMAEVRGIGLRYYRIAGLGDNILGHNSGSESILRVDLDHQLVIVMCRNAPGKNFDEHHARFIAAVAALVE